jgi:hypothetical protein
MITNIKPEVIAEGAAQVISVSLAPFNKAKEQVSLTVAELNRYLVIDSKQALDSAMEVLKIASKVEKAIESKRKDLVAPFNDGAKEINAHAKEITEGLPGAIAKVKSAVLEWQRAEEERAAELIRKARMKQIEGMGFVWNEETDSYRLDGVVGVFVKDVHLQGTDGMWSDLMTRFAEAIQEQEAEKNKALQEEDPEMFDLLGLDEVMPEVAKRLPAPSAAYFAPPKLNGAAKVWKFEITDAVAVPREYLSVDEVLVREAIRSGVREIAGVRIYQEEQLRVR